MTQQNDFRIEAALQLGFEEAVVHCGKTEVYSCTESQLIAFAKMCEQKGLAMAYGLGNRDAVYRRILEIDGELEPILTCTAANPPVMNCPRHECVRRGIDPDEICADGGVTAEMVVTKEMCPDGDAGCRQSAIEPWRGLESNT